MTSGHHHHHDHEHRHAHAPASFGRAFAIGIALNTGFVALEAGFGLLSGSMALIADAGHNLSDVLGLLIAWGATILSARAPSDRFTYGLKSSSILAALLNAALLLVAIGAITLETLRRLQDPQPVPGVTVMAVAAAGIAVNTATALLFLRGRAHDINIRGAFLHMAADAAVSAGVVISGFAILKTGATWIDPAVSLVIVVIIAIGTWGLLREALKMSLLAVPQSIDRADVTTYLLTQPGVMTLHDLHIWPISTTDTALTVHLLMPAGHPGDAWLVGIADGLRSRFGIGHATIQIETDDAIACALAPAHVI